MVTIFLHKGSLNTDIPDTNQKQAEVASPDSERVDATAIHRVDGSQYGEGKTSQHFCVKHFLDLGSAE